MATVFDDILLRGVRRGELPDVHNALEIGLDNKLKHQVQTNLKLVI